MCAHRPNRLPAAAPVLVAAALSLPVAASASDAPDAPSPLVDVAIDATGAADPVALFQPAWPGLHEVARCGRDVLLGAGAPEEITLALALTARPDGSIAAADLSEFKPESVAPALRPCVEQHAQALQLAAGERDDTVVVTVRMRLSAEGSAEPQLSVIEGAPRAERGLLAAIGEGHADAFGMVGGGDIMAIGGLTDGASQGTGGLGMRGTGLASGDRTPSGQPAGGGYGGLTSDDVPGVHVELGALQLLGMAEEQVYRRVVREHRRELRACVEQTLQQQELSSGSISLQFVVNPEGAVVSAAIHESVPGLRAVEACFVERVRRWTFPAPGGGGIVRAIQVIEVTIGD